jgi:uncharacterized protein
MAEWMALNSSNLARVRWVPQSLVLEVEFVGGRVYQYYDVPQHVFDGLCQAADSHGKFFAENIKGHYRYARL